MSGLTLRDASYSELLEISHVLGLAFFDDNLFGDIIHPHRREYPADVDLYWLRRARVNFWDYRYKWLVAVDSDENGGEAIVGVAQWTRLGDGGKALECKWYDPRNLLKTLSAIGMRIHALIWANHACDPQKEDIIEQSYPYFDNIWTGTRAESWYLDALGVHPDYQRRGIGRDLVRWGLERAEQDGVCASVISAKDKDEFYRKVGFNLQDGSATAGEGNPVRGVEGGNIWWKMPKALV